MKEKLQFAIILISSAIASLGTYPYAKDFSSSLFNNHNFALLIAAILVPAALSANIALGTYSLQNTLTQTHKTDTSRFLIVFAISSLAALSNGFMCFVGYNESLPILVNLLMSVMVVIVNAGIGFSAINTAIDDLKQSTKHRQSKSKSKTSSKQPLKVFISLITIVSALMVTLTAYLASAHGLTTLLNHSGYTDTLLQKFVNPFAVLIWFPGAVLFANGSRATVAKIYDVISQNKINFSYISLGVFIIAFASGCAYAQMSLEFFDTCKNIPDFFKNIARHYNLIFYFFMPIAFVISATVNGYALDKLVKNFRGSSFSRKNLGRM